MIESLSSTPARVLFVDDDEDVQKAASLLLGRHGMTLAQARSPAEALGRLAETPAEVVLLDLNFTRGASTGEEGLRLLADIRAEHPATVVVIVTAHSGVNMAVAAMRGGASDFVMKPWSNARLVATLEDAIRLARSRASGAAAPAPVAGAVESLLGDSPAVRTLREQVRRAAAVDAAVLIGGPAGAGKSLLARLLHRLSERSAGPLVMVEAAGSTAAELDRALAAAMGGVLVLEGVERADAADQSRIVRALEAEADVRLLSTATGSVDATRRSLRSDLFYRLATLDLKAPPLAERGDDALVLAEHWLRLYAARYRRPARCFTDAARDVLLARRWDDEARGLRHAVERAVALGEHEAIAPADLLPAAIEGLGPPTLAPDLNLGRSERALVEAALKRHSFNVSHAAQELGLTRAALYRRMAKHGL